MVKCERGEGFEIYILLLRSCSVDIMQRKQLIENYPSLDEDCHAPF